MKFEQRFTANPGFNYASLTDIVMQLLIFFLLSSSFMMTTGVKVQVPKTQTNETVNDRQTVLTVTENGRLFFNLEEVTKETLAQKLIPVIDKDPEQIIVVRADKNVSLQSAVDVMDIAKGVGGKRFLIATEQSEGAK
ncbi:MAG: ExbD/TolR family protein [Acidobacteriota bacterium]